jgi:hypothetical protein
MRLQFDRSRLDDRRHLLKRLDGIRRNVDQSGLLSGMDRIQQQAFETIVGGVADAFDLSKEAPATLRRYDTASLLRPDDISRRWKNHQNYVDNVQSLGKLLLLGASVNLVAALSQSRPTLSGTCTPIQITLAWKKECDTWVALWITLCRPSLKTFISEVWMIRSCWSPAAKWDELRESMREADETTGAVWLHC